MSIAHALPRAFQPGLAALRGIAAASVVAYHAFLLLRLGGLDDAYIKAPDPDSPGLLAWQAVLATFNGPAMVTLFFVLSGTVLSVSLARNAPFRAIAAPTLAIARVPHRWIELPGQRLGHVLGGRLDARLRRDAQATAAARLAGARGL